MSSTHGGDLSLYVNTTSEAISSANYNEIDGLVFSSIVYNRFEASEISWTKSELEDGISLQQFARKMTTANNKNPGFINADTEALLEAVANSPRYENCKVTNMAACNKTAMWDSGRTTDIKEDAQWAAMTIDINDGSDTSVIAMRGTDGTTFGWNEDFELGYEKYGTTAQRLSRDYLSACEADNIVMVGHSKGGNDVVASYMMSDKDVRDRVIQINNYDGPGNNSEFIDNYKDGYSELGDKLHNYYPQNSVVGQILNDNPGQHIYCRADTSGHMEDQGILGEHDQYSWEFYKAGTLDNAEQGDISKSLNKVLDNSLQGLTNTESRYAIQALIRVGIPAMIAHQPKEDSPVIIDYSSWQNALLSILQYSYTSVAQVWSALRLIRKVVAEGVVKFSFRIPEENEFYSWIRDLFPGFFRNFAEDAEVLWEKFIKSGVNAISPGFIAPEEHMAPTVYDFSNNGKELYIASTVGTAAFSVDADRLSMYSGRLEEIVAELNAQVDEMEKLRGGFTPIGIGYLTSELDTLCVNVEETAKNVRGLSEALSNISKQYKDAENGALSVIPCGNGG